MMDGFGYPASAGNFRFRAEARIVRHLLASVERNGTVLDLGSGVGYWAKEFAHSFSQVVAIEGSHALYPELEKRCAPYTNIRTINGNVLSFDPDGHYNLVFLGGLLMYLNEHEVIDLLQKLIPCLGPDAIILCRESTVRGETVTLTDDYPVIYRSVLDDQRIFKQCKLILMQVKRNEPYVLMQTECNLIQQLKQIVPKLFQAFRIVGCLTHESLRLGAFWIKHLPKVFRIPFPSLENHFFVLGRGANVNV